MVRISRAITYGVATSLLIGVIAFFSGWLTARAVGRSPVDTFFASVASQSARAQTPVDSREQFAVFWDVWDLVQSEFYHPKPLDRQKLVYGAIKGMLSALDDQYTTFQEPDLAAQSRETMQGAFEGIGVFLRVVAGEIVVDRPIKGSPAVKAGIEAGDVLMAIDGTVLAPLVSGLSDTDATAKVAALIRGPKGSVVTISIRRGVDTQPFDMQITRDEVPIISVNVQMLDNGVAYIQITEFKATTTQLLDEALREIIKQQPQSIVLDLRNNPGGFLTTAQEVLGRFYNGVALYEEENDGVVKELKTIAGPEDTRVYNLPMVVLINGGSASAAEIVAGALRDMRPNTSLLGEKSFGKGSVQNIHQLRDGSSARITIAHWFTPNRSEIHTIGITPQYLVPASEDAQYAVPCVADHLPSEGRQECSDAQLLWGLRLLMGQIPPLPPT
ncbi:MAG: S41 family peptidase [Oscillochloris sp.]|nr:S41 family peptidase [Oscillochloris sp.]